MSEEKADFKQSACVKCDALCCQYISIEIDEPEDKYDYDCMRWYAAHKNTYIYKDEGSWYVNVATPCEQLGEGGECLLYDERPKICRKHPADNCEFVSEYDFEEQLNTPSEVEAFYTAKTGRKWKVGKKSAKKKSV